MKKISVLLLMFLLLIEVFAVPAEAQSITITIGKPVTLTASFSVAPNDTIAPHLYVWYFDGVNDYVVIPLTVYGWSAITIQEWIYPFYPKANSLWTKFNMIGDHWTDYPSVFWSTSNRYDYTWLVLNFATRKPDGTSRYYGFSIYAYRNTWVNTAWRFSLSNRTFIGYVNGTNIYTVTVPSTEKTILEWDPNTATYPQRYKQFVLGASVVGAEHMKLMQRSILIYSRALSDSEIYNTYAYNIINSSNLVLFLDPTFYNSTHFLDLSGYGNHGVGYGNVSRVPDQRQWLYLVKNHSSDGLVHFKFFPINTRIEVYDSNNNLVTSFVITGTPNQAGLIEDYVVNLSAGNYTIKAYTYLDYTVNQNNSSTRYTYIARFSPGDTLRIMWNVTNAVAVNYQLSADPSFSTVSYEDVVSISGNYYDLALPSTNNTWYLRIKLQYSDGSWSDWSNVVSFRTDYLVMGVSSSRSRADLSTGVSASYSVSYSDGSLPPILNVNATAVLTQLGVYTPADVWWRVDVYSGATTSAEPPNPSYYTYKGTAYPLSTHSFFVNSLYDVPSGYDSSYVYAGVPFSDAPYWAKAVGAPSTYFALVYQSLVYLPLSGSYTFELVSDKGARLYVNDTLVIDGWSGAGTRSATVALNAGLYIVTIKYWQSSNTLRLLLGVTLPNGTVVKPLRPTYGIQMAPPVSSYSATLPSTPLTLFNNYVLPKTTATLSFGLGTTGQANITLQTFDPGTGFTNTSIIPLVWDQVAVNSFAPSKPRFTVGDSPSFNISAVYAFDNTTFNGSFTLNDTSTKTTVGAYGYAITAVSDPLYGLTRFFGNTTTSVIFDKLVLSSYSFVLNNNVLTNGSRIDYSYPSVNLTATFTHAYDGLPLNSTYGAVVQLAGLNASWNGSAWVATIPSPGAITAMNYQVVTNVQSTLNVRFVDASPIFRIIYDSVNSTYTTDLASNTIFIRSVYGYDGSPLPFGIACVNDAGSLVCGSISNGVANIPFNRFTKGGVVFVNANDTAFVFSNPVKPDKLVVKWASSDGKISLVGTVDAYYYNHTELPGYFRLACELRGNASVLVNTSLTPVFVKVNGAPATFNYTNGYILFYGLGSQVEVYYSTLSTPGIMPGSAPIGATYEIGFANNSYLQNATFKLGILVNGSVVTPFVEINESRTYGSGVTGLSFPLITDLSWGCPDNRPTIYYRIIYMVGDKTMSYTSSYKFDSISYTCPATLYPYIYIPGSLAGVVDKYGSVLSELLKYLATGIARITVLGNVMPGSLVEYVILNSPVTIQFNGSAVTPTQGGTAPLTLVGFRGYTLSYSVAGVTVSNILISTDPFTLNFPYGIALMVITDPSSRTVNIVQVSVPQQTINYTWPTSTTPLFVIPSLPSISFKPQLTFTWDSPTFIVLYGSMVAVAIIASRIAGSILRGVMMASVAYGFVFIGIGAFTGNLQPVMLGLLSFIVAVAMEVARRNAG